jgi:hypothetical protein
VIVPIGEERTIEVDAPVGFIVRLNDLSIVSGTILPGRPLSLRSYGIVKSVDLNVDDHASVAFRVLGGGGVLTGTA